MFFLDKPLNGKLLHSVNRDEESMPGKEKSLIIWREEGPIYRPHLVN